MTNADKFKGIFGLYATELWAKPEKEFLTWLNEDVPETNVGDMISRQSAIDALCKMRCGCVLISCPLTFEEDGTEICADVRLLMGLPSAQRKGKWIYPTDIKGYGRCPHCKALWDYSLISNPFFKFCPRCGNGENEFAELKGEEDGRFN